MQVGPQPMSRDPGDLLNLDHILSGNSIPFHHGSASEIQAVSDLCKHSAFGANKSHTVRHTDRLPQGSGLGKHNCLPTVHALNAMILFMEIGHRIKRARLGAGLSQRELATAVGVTHGLVGQWESHRKAPGREVLRRIAEVTLTDVAALLADMPEGNQGVRVTDLKQLALLRRFVRMTPGQQDNLLEFLGIAAHVRREIEQQREPAET